MSKAPAQWRAGVGFLSGDLAQPPPPYYDHWSPPAYPGTGPIIDANTCPLAGACSCCYPPPQPAPAPQPPPTAVAAPGNLCYCPDCEQLASCPPQPPPQQELCCVSTLLCPLPPPTPPAMPPKQTPKKTDIPGAKAPEIQEGFQYLYSKQHVMIFFPTDGTVPWESPSRQFAFDCFKASCDYTVKQLITYLGGGEHHKITEAWETGDREWMEGISIKYQSDDANQNLNATGWTEERGTTQPPVWVVLQRA